MLPACRGEVQPEDAHGIKLGDLPRCCNAVRRSMRATDRGDADTPIFWAEQQTRYRIAVRPRAIYRTSRILPSLLLVFCVALPASSSS